MLVPRTRQPWLVVTSCRPLLQAGVYAVRAGPILLHNLVARCVGTPLVTYRPQRDFLKLLCTGDGNAIGTRATDT